MLQAELNAIKLKREMEHMLSKNAVNMKRLHEMLETLRTMDIDLEVLRKTKIGVCVNNVRKTFKNSKEIAKSTAELIRKWKKIAKEEFRTKSESDSGAVGNSPAGSDLKSPSSNSDEPSLHGGQEDSTSNPGSDEAATTHRRNRKQNLARNASVSDDTMESSDDDDPDDEKQNGPKMPKNSVRRKSVEMLVDALNGDAAPPSNNNSSATSVLQISIEIEKHIFVECQDVNDKKYKSRMRSRVMNLRDKNNPNFRKNVLDGVLKPKTVAAMSVEEMACEKLKELRHSIEEETLEERKMKDSTESLAKSTMFCCTECGERDTSYVISQDRIEGEYEPVAVTLILCNKCGHRWKNY